MSEKKKNNDEKIKALEKDDSKKPEAAEETGELDFKPKQDEKEPDSEKPETAEIENPDLADGVKPKEISDTFVSEVQPDKKDDENVSEVNEEKEVDDDVEFEPAIKTAETENTEVEDEKVESEEQQEEIVTFEENAEKPRIKLGESNYQVSLINENLLKIRVVTEKAVEVDCFVKDKSSKSQSNKILVHPKTDGKSHEVEIVVSINPSTGAIELQSSEESGEEDADAQTFRPDQNTNLYRESKTASLPKKKFLIDPDVADLVKKQTDIDNSYKPRTYTEILEEKIGPKNRYHINREVLYKNMKRGIVGALAIFFVFSIIFYSALASKKKEENEPRPERIIIMEDIPETKIDLPYKEEKTQEEEDKSTNTAVVPPKVTTPKVKRYSAPKITKVDSTKKDDSLNIAKNNKTLDNERKGNVTNNSGDSVKVDYAAQRDSQKIIIHYTDYNWIQNKNFKNNIQSTSQGLGTEGIQICVVDSINEKSEYAFFVYSDQTTKVYTSIFSNQTEFKLGDTTLKCYSSEIKTLKDERKKQFGYLIIDKVFSNNITIVASVKEKFFDEYKQKTDDLIRRILMPLKKLQEIK